MEFVVIFRSRESAIVIVTARQTWECRTRGKFTFKRRKEDEAIFILGEGLAAEAHSILASLRKDGSVPATETWQGFKMQHHITGRDVEIYYFVEDADDAHASIIWTYMAEFCLRMN